MRTTQLIDALATDAGTKPIRFGRVFWAATILAALGGACVFFALLGPRADVMAAAETVRFLFKFVVTIALAVTAAVVLRRLTRPGAELGTVRFALFVAPALLALAVVMELTVTSHDSWTARLVGHNALFCLTMAPVLSALPLAAILIALRRSAPSSPAAAGAVAGLLAGGIGATFYAAHCVDDSPLFVAVWYPLAIGLVTLAGAAIGARLLRW
ncbi:NrsF family protein [Hansschlegelia plantiphila]|uniref:DUF1109 family protein n=1 Tax=Hansschlegelia plantiphila TaxID=374655 RepID=A0A9W6IZX8_9HYPH|nr:NrsF family protein [Hansschlegelia plantiphila]GLK67221.1 hypothetical protein GCM10008179_08590 [Hansschlegelia plantiphila]